MSKRCDVIKATVLVPDEDTQQAISRGLNYSRNFHKFGAVDNSTVGSIPGTSGASWNSWGSGALFS